MNMKLFVHRSSPQAVDVQLCKEQDQRRKTKKKNQTLPISLFSTQRSQDKMET